MCPAPDNSDIADLQAQVADLQSQVADLRESPPTDGFSETQVIVNENDSVETVEPIDEGDITEIVDEALPIEQQGDLIAGDAEGKPGALEVAPPGSVLMPDPSEPLGLRWFTLDEFQDMLTGATEIELGEGELGEVAIAYEPVTFDPEVEKTSYSLSYTASGRAEQLLIMAAGLADLKAGQWNFEVTVLNSKGEAQGATLRELETRANRYDHAFWTVDAPESGTVTITVNTTDGEPVTKLAGFIQLFELLGDEDAEEVVFHSDKNVQNESGGPFEVKNTLTAKGITLSWLRRSRREAAQPAPDASSGRSGTRVTNIAFTTPGNSFDEDVRVEVMLTPHSEGGEKTDTWEVAEAEKGTDNQFAYAAAFQEE